MKSNPAFVLACAVLLSMTLCSASWAQDRRQVSEPHIPAVCQRVSAKLDATNGGLDPADEGKLDSDRLQAALDHCAQGHALELGADGAHNAFLSGPISVPAGITLLVDRGVTLFGSRDPVVYQRTPGSCGVVNDGPSGCKPLISVRDAPHAGVMGDGVIDGRGGAQLLHGSVTWWQLAEKARAGGHQQVPRLLVIDGSDDFTAYRITLKNSANFHVVYSKGKGFTAWGVKIDTPRKARNTDGIDPGGSSDITVAHSYISTGDDNIAIKGSGSGVQHMSLLDNHFYNGHGMSIGSETFAGVSDVLVRNLTLDGADNGIRIKSNIHRGGLVQRIRYENVCIRNNKVPLTFDTRYDNPGPQANLIPEFRDVLLQHVRISGGGRVVVDGQDAQHRTQVQLDDVQLDDPAAYKFYAKNADVTYGPGPVNFRLRGEDVSGKELPATGASSNGPARDACAARFVPFPR